MMMCVVCGSCDRVLCSVDVRLSFEWVSMVRWLFLVIMVLDSEYWWLWLFLDVIVCCLKVCRFGVVLWVLVICVCVFVIVVMQVVVSVVILFMCWVKLSVMCLVVRMLCVVFDIEVRVLFVVNLLLFVMCRLIIRFGFVWVKVVVNIFLLLKIFGLWVMRLVVVVVLVGSSVVFVRFFQGVFFFRVVLMM